jgi:UDP-glucose 4-epimerase
MKILITGGSGFLGSHIADNLIAKGDQVLVIDNFATGRHDNLASHPGLSVVEGTIADERLVNELFENFKPDQVVHAAASYKDPSDWTEDIRTNVLGTAHVVRAALNTKVNRFVYFQTALCYGLHPLEQPITLNHPIRPEGSSYAISKTGGEQFISLSGLEFFSFRLANAYGPRNISGPLPTFFQRLSNGQKCFAMNTRRDFIYVKDLVEVVIKALNGVGSPGYYHISSGSDFSIKELFDATVAAMGITLDAPVEERERNPDDVFSILLDPSETNREFGWRTTTPLLEGVRNTIQYYRDYGISETYTHLHLPKE